MNERENFLKVAGDVASHLNGKGHIEKVGITGSLTRDKRNPYDIDLLVIATDKCAFESLRMLKTHPEERIDHLELLGLSQFERFYFEVKFGKYPLDIMIISGNPSQELINFSVTGVDPYLLCNISNNTLVFNTRTKGFERQTIYPQSTIEKIKGAAFKVLKEKMNDENYMEKIANSPSSKKRRLKDRTAINSMDM